MTTTPPLDGAAWTPGDFPWDRWETHARARNVPAELAQLGRSVMREAYQHQWAAELARGYGWHAVDFADAMVPVPGHPSIFTAPTEGTRWRVDVESCERMIARALQAPDEARTDWQRQLDTDGGRDYAGDWTDDDTQADAAVPPIRWYRRPELVEGWIVAACAKHGAELSEFRFRPGRAAGLPPAEFCALCEGSLTIDEVRRCTCETAPAKCPEHKGGRA